MMISWTKLNALVPRYVINISLGGLGAGVNMVLFLGFLSGGLSLTESTTVAYILTAATNYYLWIRLLFDHKGRPYTRKEVLMYSLVGAVCGVLDLGTTQ